MARGWWLAVTFSAALSAGCAGVPAGPAVQGDGPGAAACSTRALDSPDTRAWVLGYLDGLGAATGGLPVDPRSANPPVAPDLWARLRAACAEAPDASLASVLPAVVEAHRWAWRRLEWREWRERRDARLRPAP